MVDGRLRKFYEEVVLLEQIFVMDNETRIADLLVNAGKNAGANITMSAYARYQLGEGIEVEVKDFAQEVRAVAG